MIADETKDGVALGVYLGVKDGRAQVVFAENPKDIAIPARSVVALGPDDAGCEVALLFEDGDRARPLIIGRIIAPYVRKDAPEVIRDGESVRITGQERVELRCGKASIVLERDGHITIRGTYLVSQASAANRIRGGSINLN